MVEQVKLDEFFRDECEEHKNLIFYKNLKLREFQIAVKDNIIQKKSTVVVAPTGLGKTLAAILPFIKALSGNNNSKLRTRIIYTLPIRALVKGVQEEFENFNIKAVIHHGDEPESRVFTERAIITTVDQYFTSFAGAPLSWSSATSHAAAGATLTSYTVFDEVHLLNPKNGLQLLLAILKLRDRWGLPTTVMTATLPSSVIDFLKSKCGLEKVEVSEKDIKDRDSWRKVNLAFHEEELDVDGLADFVKQQFKEQRKVIVFVNTVDRAINLYEKLKEVGNIRNKVMLAHSRFSKEHRKKIEEKIHTMFGRNSDFEGILVTTQVAEAGLNISAPLVITELAPMDSLIQRAGRCARFREDSKKVKGDVIVVKPKVENGGWYAPYFDHIRLRKGGTKKGKKQKKDGADKPFINKKERIKLSELTWIVLCGKVGSSKVRLDWETEQSLLNLALDDAYRVFINGDDILYVDSVELENEKYRNISGELKEIIQKYQDKLRG